MKNQVHPAVVAVIVVVALGIIGYFFYAKTASPPPVNMNPLGPGAKLLKARGGGTGVTPDVQAMMQQRQQQQNGQNGGEPGK